jgi:hypothetical protein
MKYLRLCLLTVLLTACVNIDPRVSMPDQFSHPAMAVFLDYEKAVAESDSFNELISRFYSPAAQKLIPTKKGWYLFPYSLPFDALKYGRCESLELLNQRENSVLLSCKGPYNYRSILAGNSNETMHLRARIIKVHGQWYLDKAGMVNTIKQGQYPDISRGLKFK